MQKAAPNGSTLLLNSAGNVTIDPTLLENLSFNVGRDFAPAILLASTPNVFVAARELGVTRSKNC